MSCTALTAALGAVAYPTALESMSAFMRRLKAISPSEIACSRTGSCAVPSLCTAGMKSLQMAVGFLFGMLFCVWVDCVIRLGPYVYGMRPPSSSLARSLICACVLA